MAVMLAMRFRIKGDASGSDMWMLASDMAETGRFLAAVLIDDTINGENQNAMHPRWKGSNIEDGNPNE